MASKSEILSKLDVSEARAVLAAAIKREQAAVEKANREFRAMPKYKKRMTIAADVLQQVKLKRFIPKQRVYLELRDEEAKDRFRAVRHGAAETEECATLNNVLGGSSCEVCGIGSLFVAAAERTKACVDDMAGADDDNFMRNLLKDYFDMDQLLLIEAAFEGQYIDADDYESYEVEQEDIDEALDFTRSATTANARLERIMKNIVENRGTFIP